MKKLACKHRSCNNKVQGRKKYCSTFCKYWENQKVKDEEKHLPPKSKRTKDYFYRAVSVSLGGKGQGKRSNGMVMGSMSSILSIEHRIERITEEAVKSHFDLLPTINKIYLCNGSVITKQEYYS